jgi:hypothetical protein
MKRARPVVFVHPVWAVAVDPPLVGVVAADAAARHARRHVTGFLVRASKAALRRMVGA